MNIGKTVRELRIALEMKQNEFAAALGVSGTYVSLIEHGRAKPSPEMIIKMATRLGITPGELVVASMGDKLSQRSDIKNAAKVIVNSLLRYLAE